MATDPPTMCEIEQSVERLEMLADVCDVTGLDHLPVVSRANAAPFAEDLRAILTALRDKEAECERLRGALCHVKQMLLIPAAEYVPAIPDAWTIIDEALK